MFFFYIAVLAPCASATPIETVIHDGARPYTISLGFNRGTQALREGARGRLVDFTQQHDEFLAAEARGLVGGAAGIL